MLGFDYPMLALIFGTLIVGGVLKGITGIGLPMLSLGFLTIFLPVPLVLAIIVTPIVVTNLWQAVQAGNVMEPVRRFWPVAVALCAFLWVGAQLVVTLPPRALYAIIGACVVAFNAISYFNPSFRLPAGGEKWAGPVSGIVGGFLGGISTLFGPPIVMYFLMLDLPKETFIRAVGLIWFVASVPLLLSYIDNGILNADTWLLSVLACVPGMIGLAVGTAIRRRIDERAFRKAVLLVFFVLGLNLIRRAVF